MNTYVSPTNLGPESVKIENKRKKKNVIITTIKQ